MKNNQLNIILNSFNEKKNSHAFLMETDNIDLALADILLLIQQINSDKIGNKKIDESFTDIKVIKPEGKEIKKDQIKDIILTFQTFPFILHHKYYIIVSSELMNQSSANVLLKFLEEPDNEVIGFFITLNKKAMINTIVSRCQFFKLIYNKKMESVPENILEFISSMNSSIFERILFLNSWFKKDRVENLSNLKEVKNKLLEDIENLDKIKVKVKRINLLDECINRLGRNANQDLIILDLARKW